MRYFTYIAEQAVKTGLNGLRLFMPYGVFGRPYIIPNAEIEVRLYSKLLRETHISLGLLFVAMPVIVVKHAILHHLHGARLCRDGLVQEDRVGI